MPAGAERKVGRSGALADNAVAVVLGLFCDTLLDVLGCEANVLVGWAFVPAVGLPFEWLWEVLLGAAGDTGRSEEDVGGRNDPVGAFDGEGVLDYAHDAVNRSVDAKSFLDNLSVQRETAEILVVEVLDSAIGVDTKDLLLLLEKVVLNIGPGSETEENPADSGRGAVLASHEQSNHHVGNLAVGNVLAVLVGAVHQVPDHVFLPVSRGQVALLTPFLDNIHVHLGHLLLGSIASTVVRQRQPAELEVDRDKTTVEVVVELCETGIESFANLSALKGARGGVDGEFGESGWEVKGAVLGRETLGGCVLGEEVVGFGADEFDVGAEGGRGQAELDELWFC